MFFKRMVIHFHYYCCISSVRNFPLHPFFIVLLMCTYGNEYFVVVWPKSKFHWFPFWNIPHFALFYRLPACLSTCLHALLSKHTNIHVFVLFYFVSTIFGGLLFGQVFFSSLWFVWKVYFENILQI